MRHSELSKTLADEIADGLYPVGGQLPTERELQQRFGVGRHTVREALKTLTEQGLVGRRRRLGTRVLRVRPFDHYAHTLADELDLSLFADETRFEIRHDGFVTASPLLTELGEEAGQRWLRVAGIRSLRSNGEPLCWSEIFIPARLPLDRTTLHGLREPIYRYCLRTHGLKLDHVLQEVRATTLSAPIAALLGAEAGTAALLVTRRYLDRGHQTFEVSMTLYPADRYSLRSILRRRS